MKELLQPGESGQTSVEHPKSVAAEAAERAFRLGDTQASRLATLVASHGDVTVEELFHNSRSRAPIAATRQLAMYLMHVCLGRTMTEVGEFYGRDRTTVSYACNQVEEMRDNPAFDQQVCALEEAITSGPVAGKAAETVCARAANDD